MTPQRGPAKQSAPLAVTMGDPAGIGPEITIKAWQQRHQHNLSPFVVFADAAAIESTAKNLGIELPIKVIADLGDVAAAFKVALPVAPVPLSSPTIPGQPNPRNASAVLSSIEQAVDAVLSGAAEAVVTNPIAKSVLYDAGFKHPGHTEYLAALADQKSQHSQPNSTPVMMLMGKGLRVVPTTIHIPLTAVPAALTTDYLLQTIHTVAEALGTDFGVSAPRLAVTGLNPHAGENGAMGTEEKTIIEPAIIKARADGLKVTGPHPADTLFHAKARAAYDVAICMYHDQALIPIKTLAFDEGVNITLGLPFVRTSPDHGTAFNIAGQNRASPTSLIAAMKAASEMAEHRRQADPQSVSP
jgi:4-hydroxythreonine-4-phosphate dehydrogenase